MRYAAAVFLAAAAQVARVPLDPSTTIPYITYLPFMLLSAAYGGFQPGLVTTILCTLEALYFATEPVHSFAVRDPASLAGLGILLCTGLVTCYLFHRAQKTRPCDVSVCELAALLNQTYDAVFVWELESRKVTFWDRGARELYGFSGGEALGRSIEDLLATRFPESLAACLATIQQSAYWHGELIHTTRDGGQVTVEARMSLRHGDDGLVRVIEVARDISERKRLGQAQRQLAREREQRQGTLESIIQNSPACIAVLRGPDFIFESVNPAYQALIPAEPMVGRTVTEVWPEAAPLILPMLRIVREAQKVYHASEAIIPRRRTPQGPVEDRYFDFSYVPLRSPGSEDVQVLVAAIEVTHYKTAAKQLQAVNQELESALTQKIVLLKEVHHRVKNNLAVVSSLLGMKADTLEITEAREALEDSRRRVHSIALIHEQLYGTETPDRIDFCEYAQQLVGELHSSFVADPERIAIRLHISPIEMGVHRAVPLALLLNELVTNAFKHAFPAGRRGEVTVSLREAAPGSLEFAVEDNGIGTPPGLAGQNSKSLGLQIVDILGRQLEGSLEQQSAAGAGARFVLRFPAGSCRLKLSERDLEAQPLHG
jgi:PAS domain S-box-containing protein